jgi:hypothetical protein
MAILGGGGGTGEGLASTGGLISRNKRGVHTFAPGGPRIAMGKRMPGTLSGTRNSGSGPGASMAPIEGHQGRDGVIEGPQPECRLLYGQSEDLGLPNERLELRSRCLAGIASDPPQ